MLVILRFCGCISRFLTNFPKISEKKQIAYWNISYNFASGKVSKFVSLKWFFFNYTGINMSQVCYEKIWLNNVSKQRYEFLSVSMSGDIRISLEQFGIWRRLWLFGFSHICLWLSWRQFVVVVVESEFFLGGKWSIFHFRYDNRGL